MILWPLKRQICVSWTQSDLLAENLNRRKISRSRIFFPKFTSCCFPKMLAGFFCTFNNVFAHPKTKRITFLAMRRFVVAFHKRKRKFSSQLTADSHFQCYVYRGLSFDMPCNQGCLPFAGKIRLVQPLHNGEGFSEFDRPTG